MSTRSEGNVALWCSDRRGFFPLPSCVLPSSTLDGLGPPQPTPAAGLFLAPLHLRSGFGRRLSSSLQAVVAPARVTLAARPWRPGSFLVPAPRLARERGWWLAHARTGLDRPGGFGCGVAPAVVALVTQNRHTPAPPWETGESGCCLSERCWPALRSLLPCTRTFARRSAQPAGGTLSRIRLSRRTGCGPTNGHGGDVGHALRS